MTDYKSLVLACVHPTEPIGYITLIKSVREQARENGWDFSLATIKREVDAVRDAGSIFPLDGGWVLAPVPTVEVSRVLLLDLLQECQIVGGLALATKMNAVVLDMLKR